MQIEILTWFIGFGIPVLSITAFPAYLLWVIRGYAEAVVYNSHSPHPKVPQNHRHEAILRMYEHHMKGFDILLLSLYCVCFFLVVIAGYLLGDTQGTALGIVVGGAMSSDLRFGICLRKRIETKLEKEKHLVGPDEKLFG